MRFLRGLLGALTWLAASVVGLLGVVLCVTIILLPVGLYLLRRSGRMFRTATALMLPRAMTHPVEESSKKAGKKTRKARRKLRKSEPVKAGRKRGRSVAKSLSR